MTLDEIEKMQRNRAAGTPGPWAVSSSDSVHCQSRNGQNWICQAPNKGAISSPSAPEVAANLERCALVPDMEAHILAQQAEIKRLSAMVDAANNMRLALAGYVSADSAVRKWDDIAGDNIAREVRQ